MTTTTTPARPALDSATQMIILHVARAAGPAGCIALAGDGTGKAVSADISVGSAVCRFAPPTDDLGLCAHVTSAGASIWERPTQARGGSYELVHDAHAHLRLVAYQLDDTTCANAC